MVESENAFSRNPNMCASCSSMVDGMGDENSELIRAEALQFELRKEESVADSNDRH